MVTIGAISGPSEALPSSKLSEIPEAPERRRGAPGGECLSATLLCVLPVPGSPEIHTLGKVYTEYMDLSTFGYNCHELILCIGKRT
jgi:hypothetical protein